MADYPTSSEEKVSFHIALKKLIGKYEKKLIKYFFEKKLSNTKGCLISHLLSASISLKLTFSPIFQCLIFDRLFLIQKNAKSLKVQTI
jgi:hypothetical protein